MTTERLGFIGLGNMGHPMAANLQRAGFRLSVYNRTPGKATGFERISTSAEELVDASDIIFTMLTNDEAADNVYAAILNENIEGKLFVEMSTLSPAKSLSLAAAVRAKGASFVDAPVAGSTQPAKEGTLLIMAGGDASDIERARPYLEKMGKAIKHLGENGKGISTKIAVNYFVSILYLGLAESVLLAEKAGVAREDFLDIINNSAAGSGATRVKTPLLQQGAYPPAFALELMLKDVRLARQAGADYALSATLEQAYEAARAAGFGPQDVISIIDYLQQEKAGNRLKPA